MGERKEIGGRKRVGERKEIGGRKRGRKMPNLGTQRIGMVCHLMLVFARWLVGLETGCIKPHLEGRRFIEEIY